MVCQLFLPSLARTRMPPDPVVAECGGLPGCPARAGEAKRRVRKATSSSVSGPESSRFDELVTLMPGDRFDASECDVGDHRAITP